MNADVANSNMIQLLVKIGVFYAGADGCIDDSESNTINSFIKNICLECPAYTDINLLSSLKNESMDLEKLMKEMDEYLSVFQTSEKKEIIMIVNRFIEAVIKADGVIDPSESEYYDKWLKHFGI